jgi:DNA-binding transcriptional MerR regulator
MTETIEIPNKSHFSLNEVSSITGIKPYVLRFWETEFQSILNPIQNESGQKMYTGKDIESFLFVKKLLFDEKIPIAEAKLRLKEGTLKEDVIASPKISRTELSEKEISNIQLAKYEAKKMLQIAESLRSKYNF